MHTRFLSQINIQLFTHRNMVALVQFIVYGLLGFTHSLLHRDICDELKLVDCKAEAFHGNRLYRDNNGKIYENFCEYTQAKCRDSSLDIESVCTCVHPSFNTSSTPAMTAQPTQKPTTQQVMTQKPITQPMMTQKPTTKQVITQNRTTQQMMTQKLTAQTVMTQKATTQKLTVQPTLDSLTSLFCKNKDMVQCPSADEPICASDGNTYQNKCAFTKGQCDSPNISIAREGRC